MSVPDAQLQAAKGPAPDETGKDKAATSFAGLSPSQLAVRRFRKDRLSMASLAVVLVVLVLGILAPVVTKLNLIDPFDYHPGLLNTYLGGIPNGALGGISLKHPLGVEPGTGRDVASRLWYGITFSLTIALSASLVAAVIGAVMGIVGGFSGGLVDAVVGRIVDLTLSFPQTLMLLALSTVFITAIQNALHVERNPAAAIYVIAVLGLFGWPNVARLVRGQVLSIRQREFIEAARLLGSSRRRLYFTEVLPNVWAPLLVSFTLTMPAYVSAEAALSFLGVGIRPPTPTLGNILDGSLVYAQSDFFFFFFPAVLIAVIVVSFNLLGDGVRDALDPKSDR